MDNLQSNNAVYLSEFSRQLLDYLHHPASEILIVCGPQSNTKTNLLAQALTLFNRQIPDAQIFAYLGDLRLKTDNIPSLLAEIRQHIAEAFGQSTAMRHIAWPLTPFNPAVQEKQATSDYFHQGLPSAEADMPLVIVLDGLEFLTPQGQVPDLDWLPFQLPPHVALILSIPPEAWPQAVKASALRLRWLEIPRLAEERQLDNGEMHIQPARDVSEVFAEWTDAVEMANRIQRDGLGAVITDLAKDISNLSALELTHAGDQETVRLLRLVHHALLLSARALHEDPGQVSVQILARLMGEQSPLLHPFKHQLEKLAQEAPRLRPTQVTLAQAGGRLEQCFLDTGGTKQIQACPNGQYLVSIAENCLSIWNLEQACLERSIFSDDRRNRFEALAISPDGNRLATLTDGGILQIWSAHSGRCLFRNSENQAEIEICSPLVFSTDGQQVVYIMGGSLRVWEFQAKTPEISYPLPHPGERITAFAVYQDALFAGSDQGLIYRWQICDGGLALQAQAQVFGSPVIGLAAHPTGDFLAATGQQSLVFIDCNTLEVQRRSPKLGEVTEGLSITPNGQLLVMATSEYPRCARLKVWNLASKRFEMTLPVQSSRVQSLAALSGGKRVAVGASDGSITIWNLDGQVDENILRHDGDISALMPIPAAIASGNRRYTHRLMLVCSADPERSAGLWDADHCQALANFTGLNTIQKLVRVPPRALTTGAPNSDAIDFIASGISESFDILRLEKLLSGEPKVETSAHFEGHRDPIQQIAVSADGRYAITADQNDTFVWDLARKELCHKIDEMPGQAVGLALTSDGLNAFSEGADRQAHLWNIADGEEMPLTLPDSRQAAGMMMTPDDKYLIVGFAKGKLIACEMDKVRELRIESNYSIDLLSWNTSSQPQPLAITPDGRYLVACAHNGRLSIWEIASGKCQAAFTLDQEVLACALATPIGQPGCQKLLLALGERGGRLHWLEVDGLQLGAPILAIRTTPEADLVAQCSFCGQVSEINPNDIGEEWACPNCRQTSQLTTFVVEHNEPIRSPFRMTHPPALRRNIPYHPKPPTYHPLSSSYSNNQSRSEPTYHPIARPVVAPPRPAYLNKQIYISYTPTDRNVAEDICEQLEAHHIGCWLLARDADREEDKWEQIKQAINHAEVVVFIVSDGTLKSNRIKKDLDWVNYRQKAVVTFRPESERVTDPEDLVKLSQRPVDCWNMPTDKRIRLLISTLRAMLPQLKPPQNRPMARY